MEFSILLIEIFVLDLKLEYLVLVRLWFVNGIFKVVFKFFV